MNDESWHSFEDQNKVDALLWTNELVVLMKDEMCGTRAISIIMMEFSEKSQNRIRNKLLNFNQNQVRLIVQRQYRNFGKAAKSPMDDRGKYKEFVNCELKATETYGHE